MSKYIKLEDVINVFGRNSEYHADTIADMLLDLPTIEVSEDCISREYLEEQLQQIEDITAMAHIDLGEDPYDETEEITMPISTVRKIFKNAPSVVPRLDKEDLEDIYEHISESYVEGYMDGHAEGEWINQEQGAFYPVECSNCHKQPLLNEDEDYEYTKYCPYCGAKMKV